MTIPTTTPLPLPGTKVANAIPELQLTAEHRLCAGCGHGAAWRIIMEALEVLGLHRQAVMSIGHGCYTGLAVISDIDVIQVCHGRAPSVATGIKRVHPDATVLSVQGDGDMSSEGLHEAIHTASRGEPITAIMLNNGVFGDTGGQMTGSSVVGQRTKTSIAGRDPSDHGYPVPLGSILASLPGVAYVARGAVDSPGAAAKTKKYLVRAFEAQRARAGFSFVEVLTMCPTGWFIGAPDGPAYVRDTFEPTYPIGELRTWQS